MTDYPSAACRPLIAPLVPGIPGLAWTKIRAAAVDLADHGWPILPGTYQLAEHGAWLGKPGAAGLEPAAALWQLATTTDPRGGAGIVDTAALLGTAGARKRGQRGGGARHPRPARLGAACAVRARSGRRDAVRGVVARPSNGA